MAVAVSFSLAVSAGARAADPGQAEKEKSKKMTKTESGLQYRDIKEGTGEKPKTGQTCVVHYTGWLWENKEKGKKRPPAGAPVIKNESRMQTEPSGDSLAERRD